ncbi:MAG: membrane dipeptidase, partial [Flavisolibacter sp.]|nr:membrane dipeptidase [Flavisolibacter sp.]
MLRQPYIDFHCHPQMKPYGRSFKNARGQNSTSKKKENSIWFYDAPNLFERALQLLCGICKFSQADCTTLAYGNVKIVCASLYPIERGFFLNDLGGGVTSELANDFITCLSRPRVDYIQKVKNYFEDLQREYDYYEQLNRKVIPIDNANYAYVLVSSINEIENCFLKNVPIDNVVFVIPTIEGLHSLDTNIDTPPDESVFIENVSKIKQWRCPPFFVTFSHHFGNRLCGHARSLTDLVGNVTDQRFMLNEGFTPLGRKVLSHLLDENNGKRIYIDVKHMSAKGRQEYYDILAADYAHESIPIIISHGACNGYRSNAEQVIDTKETGLIFLHEDINFYDEEILLVAKSKGIFGLQLDERRIANKATLNETKHSARLNKVRHYRAALLWNQVQHIAELLDRHDLFAWDCMALG